MGIFITSESAATVHGVYGIEDVPPTTPLPTGTTRVGLVGAFPWGPKDQRYEPTSAADAKNVFAPKGFTRTGSAYLMLISKAFPDLTIVRVLGSTSSAGSATLPDANPTDIITFPAKYHGPASSSFTWEVSAADDGDSNHFNFTVTMTGPSGTTTDVVKNFNASGTGTQTVFTQAELDSFLLIGQPTILANGRPVNDTGTFTAGSDGTINSGAYLGTPGDGNLGVALFEGDDMVRFVCADNPGNSLRDAVNAGLEAHALLMGDRVAIISGDSGQTSSAAQTDAATYNATDRVIYVDPWVYQRDDVTAAEHLVPGTAFVASVAAQTSVSTSVAWKATEQRAKLQGISRLEYDRGLARSTNTTKGVMTLMREATGGFSIESGILTCALSSPAKKNLTRRRTLDYIATSLITGGLREYVDAPNVQILRDEIEMIIRGFLDVMKRAANSDPIHQAHIVDYRIPPLTSANDDITIEQGKFRIPMFIQTSSALEQVFLVISGGTAKIITADTPNG